MNNFIVQGQKQDIYDNITSTIHGNWNLSSYARTQKELRLEASKLPKEQQEQRLIEVFNNRPPVQEDDIKQTKTKKLTTYKNAHFSEKSQYGVINPQHQFEDPRVSLVIKKQKEEEWFQQRSQKQNEDSKKQSQDSRKKTRPSTAKVRTTNEQVKEPFNFEIQTKKIEIKPPPICEREKPFMQEHLVSPYIYIQKIIKKNSEESNMKHPDIWDKSTNKKSLRLNRQDGFIELLLFEVHDKKPPKGSSKVQSKLEKQKSQKEKDERKTFYLQNLRMREFLFKFFKIVNRLLKEKHYSKIIYSGGDVENYDLHTLFKIWAKHKQIHLDAQYFLSKEQFCDFMLVIGLDPANIAEAERFFEYCHEMVQTGVKEVNQKGVIVPRWFKQFEEGQKAVQTNEEDELAGFV